MPNQLLLQLTDPFNGYLSYLKKDELGNLLSSSNHCKMNELPKLNQIDELIILVPAQTVFLTTIQLPKLSKKRLMKAVSLALEDKIVDELENIHFAIGEYNNHDSSAPVAVVSKTKMDAWVLSLGPLLNETSRFKKIMLSEALLLPFNPGRWVIYSGEKQALVRMGLFSGFGAEARQLWTILAMYLRGEELVKPDTIEIIGQLDVPEEILGLLKEAKIKLEFRPTIDKLLLMAGSIKNELGINLLQGAYQVHFKSYSMKKLYLVNLALLGILLTMLTLASLTKIYLLGSQQKTLNHKLQALAEINSLQPFGSRAKLKERMTAELEKLRKSNSASIFLKLIRDFSPIISQTPGIQLVALEYEANELNLELESDNFADLDKLTNSLKAQDFTIDQQEEVKTASVIKAHFRIKEVLR